MNNLRYLPTSWGEMAYADSGGTGCTFLFLHGTGCDSKDWMSVIDFLLSDQRSITIDFRGHGKSSVPSDPFTIDDLAADVIHLIDTLNPQRVVLVGHSLGGMVAISVAQRCPLVSGLVLLEGWTSLSSAGSAFGSGRFYGSLSDAQKTNLQHKSEETRSRFHPDVWNRFWTTVREFDGYSYLETSSIPIYEVFGEMGRNEFTEHKLHIPPNPIIQIVWLPNAGHYLPHECPEAVAEICQSITERIYDYSSGISTGKSSRSPHSFQDPI